MLFLFTSCYSQLSFDYPVVKEKIKVQLAPAIPTSVPTKLTEEIIYKLHHLYLNQNFVYVIKSSNIFASFFTA